MSWPRLKSVVCNDAKIIKSNKKNKAWGSGRVRLGYKVGSLKLGVICVACLIVVVLA